MSFVINKTLPLFVKKDGLLCLHSSFSRQQQLLLASFEEPVGAPLWRVPKGEATRGQAHGKKAAAHCSP